MLFLYIELPVMDTFTLAKISLGYQKPIYTRCEFITCTNIVSLMLNMRVVVTSIFVSEYQMYAGLEISNNKQFLKKAIGY